MYYMLGWAHFLKYFLTLYWNHFLSSVSLFPYLHMHLFSIQFFCFFCANSNLIPLLIHTPWHLNKWRLEIIWQQHAVKLFSLHRNTSLMFNHMCWDSQLVPTNNLLKYMLLWLLTDWAHQRNINDPMIWRHC